MKKADIFILIAAIPVIVAAYVWLFFSILCEALRSTFKSRKKAATACK